MLSVIIPTYNRPEKVCLSIKSVLEQTYQNIEIIVIDGSDNQLTTEQITKFNDTRIMYYKIINKSAAHSRNTGLKMARGKFIAFNDDDDIWDPCKAERQIKCLESDTKYTVVYSPFIKKIDGKNRLTPNDSIAQKSGDIFNNLLLQNFIGLPTVMLLKTSCDNIMFDERLTCIEDWEWLIRLARKNRFNFINQPLVNVSNTPESLNKSNYKIKAIAYHKIYLTHFTEINQIPLIHAKHLLSIGNNFYLAGQVKKGRKFIYQSLMIKHFQPVTFICYVLSYFGTNIYSTTFKLYERLLKREP